ncbi:sulfate/molybdate ABC transporter ATP-binding protein [Peribacillus sp. SCS-155]|uniref:sulfate/molybdate ABC transporter ATP-binding protein n=1 Tax=Peribacillus sedimenti TaxID=3115297 RepID=UPI003905F6DA
MSIKIENISKFYGDFTALEDINLDIQTGELVALLGPSGSGKTSLLRIIAGLERADTGSILFDNNEITDIDTKDRKVGFVFQHYALFRHMTVFDNIAFGLRVRPRKNRPSKKEIEQKVSQLLELVKLESFAKRYPSQLSGGQRQRVALARALAVEPKVLLLDEPFGALDAKVRKELRRWLRRLHNEFQITSIFVTHDQEEALDVADRIVVMNEGKIEQIGRPEDVYEHPQTPFVYDFIGSVNVFHGRLQDGKLQNGSFQLEAFHSKQENNKEAVGYVRPHELYIFKAYEQDSLSTTINHIHLTGPIVQLELRRKDTDELLEAEITKETYEALRLEPGAVVYVKPKKLKVFIPNNPNDYTI